MENAPDSPVVPPVKKRRPRGSGHIFKRGEVYWIQYHHNHKPVRETTNSRTRGRAEAFLRARLAEIETGTFRGVAADRVLIGTMVEDMFRRKAVGIDKGIRSLIVDEQRWRLHLAPVFAHMKAKDCTGATLSKYAAKRKADGAENSTINRELAILSRAFWVYRETVRRPPFERLKESNVRKNFLEPEQIDRLALECAKEGLWLRAILAIGCTLGWRRGELLGVKRKGLWLTEPMKVRQIDLVRGWIRLDTSKNEDAREAKMPADVAKLVAALCEGKKPDDYVFTRDDGTLVKDFRGAWKNACTRAGVPTLMVHDMRRSAARNLRRLGIEETAILKVGGWRTPSVFRRYSIFDQKDYMDVAQKLDEQRRNLDTLNGTIAQDAADENAAVEVKPSRIN